MSVIPTKIHSKNVIFIDTPGFDDTCYSDAEVLESIVALLEAYSNENIKLSAVLYLYRIGYTRISAHMFATVSQYRRLLGAENMQILKLVTTFWDQIEPSQQMAADENERYLAEAFWSRFPAGSGPVDPSSQRVSRSDGSKASALRIVQEVMQSKATIPQLKRELEACTSLSDTSAGSAIMEELRAFKEDKRREIESLQEELLRNPQLSSDVHFRSYVADVERQKAETETRIERWGQPIGEYLKPEIQASTARVLSSGAKCAVM